MKNKRLKAMRDVAGVLSRFILDDGESDDHEEHEEELERCFRNEAPQRPSVVDIMRRFEKGVQQCDPKAENDRLLCLVYGVTFSTEKKRSHVCLTV